LYLLFSVILFTRQVLITPLEYLQVVLQVLYRFITTFRYLLQS